MELVKTSLLPSSSLKLHKMKKRQVVLPPTPDKKQNHLSLFHATSKNTQLNLCWS